MRIISAVFRRDWSVEKTYQLRLFLRLFDVVLIATAIYFMSLLVQDP